MPRLGVVALGVLLAASASADVLTVNNRNVGHIYAGDGLAIGAGVVWISVEDEAIADDWGGVVFRSSFDAVPWEWRLDYRTHMSYGSGLCVMSAGPTEAMLNCE